MTEPSASEIARQLMRRLDLPGPVTEFDDPDGRPDRLLLVAGDDALVAIAIEPNMVMVGPGRIRWHGPSTPQPEVRDPEHFEAHGDLSDDLLEEIQQAVRRSIIRRRRGFRRCRYCGELSPPEHRNAEPTVCDGCAQRHLGVVF